MSSDAELTLHNGRRVGIPAGSGILVVSLEHDPAPVNEKAKTLVRYSIDGQTPKHAEVRDTFKQVLSKFPLSLGGQAWAHLTNKVGDDVAIIHKTAAGYEETEDGVFRVIFAVPTGPIELDLKAAIEDVQDLLRPDPPAAPAPAPEAREPTEAPPAPPAPKKAAAAKQ